MTDAKDSTPGEELYAEWRKIADRTNAATYSWLGMPEAYKSTWQEFAIRVYKLIHTNKAKETKENKEA